MATTAKVLVEFGEQGPMEWDPAAAPLALGHEKHRATEIDVPDLQAGGFAQAQARAVQDQDEEAPQAPMPVG
jgi:hypothetical protein